MMGLVCTTAFKEHETEYKIFKKVPLHKDIPDAEMSK